MKRIAYLVTHPIQYQAPLLRYIVQNSTIELKVFFCSSATVKGYLDQQFNRIVEWDVPLLDGYEYEFLPTLGGDERITAIRPVVHGLSKRLRRGRFDALWVHGWGHWSHPWAIAIAKNLGIRTLLRGEATLRLPCSGFARRHARNAFLSWLFGRVDAFLAIGSWNAAFYEHWGVSPDRIFTMPYAVDNAFFQAQVSVAARERSKLKASLGLEGSRPIILYASKMTDRKRAQDLLEAYVRLSPDGEAEPDPYLLLIGDGEMRPVLEQRIQPLGWKSIRFLGFKNQTELSRYYDVCDVFVLPSVHEPWGLVVNEAMNAGKAIIGSDQVGSAADLIRHGENGFVFRAGDVRALSAALRSVLSDDAYIRMGAKSLEIINRWSFKEDMDGLCQALGVPVRWVT